MSISKAEKEKLQLIQEKSQQILSELLKDEDNKYCVDCDAPGPRWASWNIGIFLCIRCAGIHRNLGVHISRVKSVNLDSWSPEQVGYMQLMGNSKARAVYEANLPDNFMRPQTDSSLEAFVRAKYEHKKYIAKEWIQPAAAKPAFDIEEERKKEKEKKRSKIIKVQTNSTIIEVQTNPVPRPHSSPAGTAIDAEEVLTNNNKNCSKLLNTDNYTDLIGLTTTSIKPNNNSDDDQFDAFVSCPPVNKSTELIQPDKAQSNKTKEEEDFFNQKVPEEKKKLDKESILKLYESSNLNQVQNNLFNMTGTTPLQPMNVGSNPLLVNGFNGAAVSNVSNKQQAQLVNNLFNSPPAPSSMTSSTNNVINNEFANFNTQSPANQQPFLAFNQTTAAAVQSTTIINHNLTSANTNSTNPFLTPTPLPATNGQLTSADLFSRTNLNITPNFGETAKLLDCTKDNTIDTLYNIDDFAKESKYRLQLAHIHARELLNKAKMRNKLNYDKTAKPIELKENDEVIMTNDGRKNKYETSYKGPYLVEEIGISNVKIKDLKTNKTKDIHKNRLRKINFIKENYIK